MSCKKPNYVILHQTIQLTSGRYIWHDLRDHCIACVHRLWIILPHLFIRGHICRRWSISYKHEKVRINLNNLEYVFIHSTVVNTQKYSPTRDAKKFGLIFKEIWTQPAVFTVNSFNSWTFTYGTNNKIGNLKKIWDALLFFSAFLSCIWARWLCFPLFVTPT